MRPLIIIFFVFVGHVSFGQNQNVAVIVEEHSGQFDVVFFSKIILLFVIAIIALVSYLNYKKEEKSIDV